MSRMAPLLAPRIPVLVVIGNEDPLFPAVRGYLFDKLPAQPNSRLLEVRANHVKTPAVAADAIAGWIAALPAE
jgi:hypothetical protein